MASEPSTKSNLFRDAPTPLTLPEEAVERIASGKGVRIERIVSTGHVSPDDFWYDSEECEWVTVLSGEGKLRFKEDDELVHLKVGDHITIGPHQRHRVDWTSQTEPTIWLAVYYPDPGELGDE